MSSQIHIHLEPPLMATILQWPLFWFQLTLHAALLLYSNLTAVTMAIKITLQLPK